MRQLFLVTLLGLGGSMLLGAAIGARYLDSWILRYNAKLPFTFCLSLILGLMSVFTGGEVTSRRYKIIRFVGPLLVICTTGAMTLCSLLIAPGLLDNLRLVQRMLPLPLRPDLVFYPFVLVAFILAVLTFSAAGISCGALSSSFLDPRKPSGQLFSNVSILASIASRLDLARLKATLKSLYVTVLTGREYRDPDRINADVGLLSQRPTVDPEITIMVKEWAPQYVNLCTASDTLAVIETLRLTSAIPSCLRNWSNPASRNDCRGVAENTRE